MDEPDAKDSRGKGRAGHQGPQDTVGESDFAQELVGCDVVRPEGPVSHSLALWGAGGLDRVGLRQRARQDRCGQAEPLMGMESSTRCRSHGGEWKGWRLFPPCGGGGGRLGAPVLGLRGRPRPEAPRRRGSGGPDPSLHSQRPVLRCMTKTRPTLHPY